MKISNNVEMLEISLDSLGIKGFKIYPVVLHDDNSVILVDTGLSGLLPIIKDEILKLDLSLSDITKVVITHGDLDHIGNLASIKKLRDNLQIVAHEEEKGYIEFKDRLSKITPEKYNELKGQLKSDVSQIVGDGDELKEFGGITVIHTPGHTPGHICLYLKKHKVLIAGDALNIIDGELLGPHPRHTLDMKQAIDSLKKLLDYDIESVICYHGGLYKGDIEPALNELLKIK